jgi:hypothetical protein
MAEIGDLPVKTMALPYFDEIDYKGFWCIYDPFAIFFFSVTFQKKERVSDPFSLAEFFKLLSNSCFKSVHATNPAISSCGQNHSCIIGVYNLQ